MVRGNVRDAIDRSTNRVRRIRDAEGSPRMSARSLIGDPVASGAQRAMHDALDAGAVQGDECRRADGRMGGWAEQMADPTEITGSLLTHGRRKKDRSARFDARPDQRLADRDERSQTARVVGDARTLESRAAARHGNIELGSKDRIEMRAEHNAIVSRFPFPAPAAHVADSVNRDLVQPGLTEHMRHPRAARSFRSGRRGNCGQRSLAAECRFVGVLDVRARGAHAFVQKDGVDHVSKLCLLGRVLQLDLD